MTAKEPRQEQVKDEAFNTFRDDLANWVRARETGRGQAWDWLDAGVREYWRDQSQSLLELLAEQGVTIETSSGAMKLKDLM